MAKPINNPCEFMAGILYIVATPIGNLEDMTFRAVRILQTVDLIAAEDTRHTGKLLQHFQITTPQISYHEHNSAKRVDDLIASLQEGKTMALVTDAGMPGISDPGYDLIRVALAAGILVVPIPGATAAITALAASGLPTDKFIFEGFLSTKPKTRSAVLASLVTETRTAILYESPHRLGETLSDLARVLGHERRVVLAREVTKLYEEFWRGSLGEAIALGETKNPKGEYTIVIGGAPDSSLPELSHEEVMEELKVIMLGGVSRSQASKQLAQVISLSRREIYQLALQVNLGGEAE